MRALSRLHPSSCRFIRHLSTVGPVGACKGPEIAGPGGFGAVTAAAAALAGRRHSPLTPPVASRVGDNAHELRTIRASSSSSSRSRSGVARSSGGSSGRLKSRNPRATASEVQAPPAVSSPRAPAAMDATPGQLPKAYVRAPPGGDTLVVTITLGAKTCNLNRPVDEPLDKALTRLAKNLMAKPSKKEKRKKPPASGGVSGPDTSADDPGAPLAVLFEDAEGTRPVDRALPNGEAWLRGAVLEVAGERFAVELNPPTVDKLYIDRLAMVGYPTAAAVSISYAEASACRWRWSAQRPGSSGGEWVDLGCGTQYYTPTAQDEGSVLRVECTPAATPGWKRRGAPPGGRSGGDVEMMTASASAALGDSKGEEEEEEELWLGEAVAGTTGPVQRGPSASSATIRCVYTPTAVQPPGFRILSYNILADQYAGSDYAQNVLFNYCPKECLDPGYRRALVLRELLGYRADLACLQEVDERAFTDFLKLHMGLQGYSGHYTNKQGKVREGSATFWRTSRFTALAHLDIRLREAFARPLPPLHGQFAPLLDASRELEAALQQVTTIAQATLLAPREGADGGGGGCLCVVNTHLFFHPYAPHIRTMHTAAILEEVAAFLERCAADPTPELAAALGGGGRRPTVLFVGDLNSDLNDGIPGVIELLRRGKLPADYWDWVQGAAFKWGMGEEDAEAMAQGTAQIAAAASNNANTNNAKLDTTAAAAAAAPTAAADTDKEAAAAAAAAAASASASVSSLFAADGHAFDSAAAAPHHPIPVTGIDISAPFVLRSADDLATPYTNYTSGYKALLDYVWYEESALRVVRSVPIPSEAELGSFIPSRSFPSDHLAVVYDMEWRQQGEEEEEESGK